MPRGKLKSHLLAPIAFCEWSAKIASCVLTASLQFITFTSPDTRLTTTILPLLNTIVQDVRAASDQCIRHRVILVNG